MKLGRVQVGDMDVGEGSHHGGGGSATPTPTVITYGLTFTFADGTTERVLRVPKSIDRNWMVTAGYATNQTWTKQIVRVDIGGDIKTIGL